MSVVENKNTGALNGPQKHSQIKYIRDVIKFLDGELETNSNKTGKHYRQALKNLDDFITTRCTAYSLWKCGVYLANLKEKILETKRKSEVRQIPTLTLIDLTIDDECNPNTILSTTSDQNEITIIPDPIIDLNELSDDINKKASFLTDSAPLFIKDSLPKTSSIAAVEECPSDHSVLDMEIESVPSVDENLVEEFLKKEENKKLFNQVSSIMAERDVEEYEERLKTKIFGTSSDEDSDSACMDFENDLTQSTEVECSEAVDDSSVRTSPKSTLKSPGTFEEKKFERCSKVPLRQKLEAKYKEQKFKLGDASAITTSLKKLKSNLIRLKTLNSDGNETSPPNNRRSSDTSTSPSSDSNGDKLSPRKTSVENINSKTVQNADKTTGVHSLEYTLPDKSNASTATSKTLKHIQKKKSNGCVMKISRRSSSSKKRKSSSSQHSSSDSSDEKFKSSASNKKSASVVQSSESKLKKRVESASSLPDVYSKILNTQTGPECVNEQQKSKLSTFKIPKYSSSSPIAGTKRLRSNLNSSDEEESSSRNDIHKAKKWKKVDESCELMEKDKLHDTGNELRLQLAPSCSTASDQSKPKSRRKKETCSCAEDVALELDRLEALAKESSETLTQESNENAETNSNYSEEAASAPSTSGSTSADQMTVETSKNQNESDTPESDDSHKAAVMEILQEAMKQAKNDGKDIYQTMFQVLQGKLSRAAKSSETDKQSTSCAIQKESTPCTEISAQNNNDTIIENEVVSSIQDTKDEPKDNVCTAADLIVRNRGVEERKPVISESKVESIEAPLSEDSLTDVSESRLDVKKKESRELRVLHEDLKMLEETRRDNFLSTTAVRTCRISKSRRDSDTSSSSMSRSKSIIQDSDNSVSDAESTASSLRDCSLEKRLESGTSTERKRKRGRPLSVSKKPKMITVPDDLEEKPKKMKACPLSVKIRKYLKSDTEIDSKRCYKVIVLIPRMSKERIEHALQRSDRSESDNTTDENDVTWTAVGSRGKKKLKLLKLKKSKNVDCTFTEPVWNICERSCSANTQQIDEVEKKSMKRVEDIEQRIAEFTNKEYIRDGLEYLQISLMKIYRDDNKLLYQCNLAKPLCRYYSSDIQLYAHHLNFNHRKQTWNGNCPYCKTKVQRNGDLIDALTHLMDEHLINQLEADLTSETTLPSRCQGIIEVEIDTRVDAELSEGSDKDASLASKTIENMNAIVEDLPDDTGTERLNVTSDLIPEISTAVDVDSNQNKWNLTGTNEDSRKDVDVMVADVVSEIIDKVIRNTDKASEVEKVVDEPVTVECAEDEASVGEQSLHVPEEAASDDHVYAELSDHNVPIGVMSLPEPDEQSRDTEPPVLNPCKPRIRVLRLEGDRLSRGSICNYIEEQPVSNCSSPLVLTPQETPPLQGVSVTQYTNDNIVSSVEEILNEASSDISFIPVRGTENERKLIRFFKCHGFTNGTCSFTTSCKDAFEEHLLKSHPMNKKNKDIQPKYLQCVYCTSGSHSFRIFEELEHHLNTVHKFCDFQCPYCIYRACRPKLVIWHLSHKHPNEPVNILVSSMKDNHDELFKHCADMFCNDYVQPFQCTLGCNFSTQSYIEFREHNKTNHRFVSQWSCVFCNKEIFVSLDSFLKHLSMIHGTAEFQCVYCKHGTINAGHMESHLTQNHPHLYPKYAVRSTQSAKNVDTLSTLIVEDLDSDWKSFVDNFKYIDSVESKNAGENKELGFELNDEKNTSSVMSPSIADSSGSETLNYSTPTLKDSENEQDDNHLVINEETGLKSGSFPDMSNLSDKTGEPVQHKRRGRVRIKPLIRRIIGLSGHELFRCGLPGCTVTSADANSFREHVTTCDFFRHSKTIVCPHCSKKFITPSKFLSHISSYHGPCIYWCSLCDFKRPVKFHVGMHIQKIHKVTQLKTIEVKNSNSETYYLIAPAEKSGNNGSRNQDVTRAASISGTSSASTTPCSSKGASPARESVSSKVAFSLQDLNAMTLGPVLCDPIRCGLCGSFETKVRTNIVNHMKLHEIGIASYRNIVNPVPKKADCEKMFYKAANHAAYVSKNSNKSNLRIKQEVENCEDDRIPAYVPRIIRFRCSICTYTAKKASCLKHHYENTHAYFKIFKCPHRPCKFEMPISKIPVHLKYHGPNLYKCSVLNCDFVHHERHVFDTHFPEKHDRFNGMVMVLREYSIKHEEDLDNQARQTYKSIEDNTNNENNKSWECLVCNAFKTTSESEMRIHCANIHRCLSRYKCCYCSFADDSAEIMDTHIVKKHQNVSLLKFSMYRKINDSSKESICVPESSSAAIEKSSSNQNSVVSSNTSSPERRSSDSAILPQDVKVPSIADEPKNMIVQPYPTGEFKCPFCTNFKCIKIEEMRDHIYKERKYLRFFCKTCGKEAVHKQELERHLDDHTMHSPNECHIQPYTPNESFEKKVNQALDHQQKEIDNMERRRLVENVEVIYIYSSDEEDDECVILQDDRITTTSTVASGKNGSNLKPSFQDCIIEHVNKNQTSDARKNCTSCGTGPFTNVEFDVHERDVHKQINCLRCFEVFKGENNYRKHIKSSIEKDCIRKNTENFPFAKMVNMRCPTCLLEVHLKDFTNYECMLSHIKTHGEIGNVKNTSIIVQIDANEPRYLMDEEIEMLEHFRMADQITFVKPIDRNVARKRTSSTRKPLNVHNKVDETAFSTDARESSFMIEEIEVLPI